jgi:predicted metalloprotease with PDZ domain
MKPALITAALAAALLGSGAITVAQTADTDKYAPEIPDAPAYATQSNPMTLTLDARNASRGLMYSHMSIPVKPGAFTFVYPKWIPGEHGPTGPLSNIAQVRVSANGHALSWRRDVVDMYAFHVDVPQGVSRIDVDFTVLANGADRMTSKNVAIVNWNRDLFYQHDVNSHTYYVKPSILLPRGWGYATALYGARQTGDRVDFDVTPLNMLIDSPLDMGRYFQHILLWKNGDASQWLDIFADKPQDFDYSPQVLDAYKRVPAQTFALYGSRHWTWYHSLLVLSDAIPHQGIEHHQSSDDRAPDDYLTDAKWQLRGGDLVTHEISHSWNGKYRRPWDLTTLNFQIPMRTDLLWVYEGMNQYLGDLISFRSGIRSSKDYPEYLASIWAQMDSEPGRKTEPLIDTTIAAPYLYEAEGQYSQLRRTAGDFYTEGELIWLDADTIIRQKTGGAKSLDTFLHAFTEPGVTGPITKTYTRDDVEHTLSSIAPFDWHGFFQRYVYEISPHPPSDDLARAGWRLVFNATPNKFISARSSTSHFMNYWYSLGINLTGKGEIMNVREDSPAWKAGLAPGVKVLAVNGQEFDPDALEAIVKYTQHSSDNIVFIADNEGTVGTYTMNYHGGLRYPHLQRISGTPDMLAKIMAAH